MTIVIFGASGPTGRLLTRRALDAGHAVTAVTRRPGGFPLQQEQLRVVKGDVLDAASVESALAGQDAVFSVYGVPYSFKPITVYSQGIANILRAMQRSGTHRLICVSSGGTNPQYDRREGLVFGRIIKPIIGKTLYDDLRRMEHLVMQSDVDWTIVRPARLTQSATVSPYQVAEGGYMVDQGRSTSRADLADFFVRQVNDDRYIRKAVAIATPSRVPGGEGPRDAS